MPIQVIWEKSYKPQIGNTTIPMSCTGKGDLLDNQKANYGDNTAGTVNIGEYPNGIITRVGIPSSSQMDATTGIIEDAWLATAYSTLTSGANSLLPTSFTSADYNTIQDSNMDDPATAQNNPRVTSYVAKENAFRTLLLEEYCYYQKRYFFVLDKFLSELATVQGQAATQKINALKSGANSLNKRLNTLIQISNYVAMKRYDESKNAGITINSENAQLQTYRAKLQEHANILTKESNNADLYKRMVEYTTEKNKANTNLLTLYACLNIIALAMIVKLARD